MAFSARVAVFFFKDLRVLLEHLHLIFYLPRIYFAVSLKNRLLFFKDFIYFRDGGGEEPRERERDQRTLPLQGGAPSHHPKI